MRELEESGKHVSSYAADRWKAFNKKIRNAGGAKSVREYYSAISETLAEVAKGIHMGKRDSLPKAWVDLHDELDEVYRGLK